MKTRHSSKRREDGMAVIVMLALLSLMLACITANLRSLRQLHQELKLVEQRQTRRLTIVPVTNSPAIGQTAPTSAP